MDTWGFERMKPTTPANQPTPAKQPVAAPFPQTEVLVESMLVITASDELFNHVDDNLPMWAGEGDRAVSVDIVFARAFKEPPAITLGLTGIDCDHTNNQRFRLTATKIKATGFKIEFATWATTHIARAGVSWQAIGVAKPNPVEASNKALSKLDVV
jgi:hypothetical protein